MPTPAEGLPPGASDSAVKKAISDTIAMLIKEGQTQEQAAATAYSQARKSTGRSDRALALSHERGV